MCPVVALHKKPQCLCGNERKINEFTSVAKEKKSLFVGNQSPWVDEILGKVMLGKVSQT